MNAYDVHYLLLLLQRPGVKDFYAEFTQSIDEFGLILYFWKPAT